MNLVSGCSCLPCVGDGDDEEEEAEEQEEEDVHEQQD